MIIPQTYTPLWAHPRHTHPWIHSPGTHHPRHTHTDTPCLDTEPPRHPLPDRPHGQQAGGTHHTGMLPVLHNFFNNA